MKKTFVLVVLFVFPLVTYLFFASGVNNFGRLPILTTQISDIRNLDSNLSFEGKITILGFLGEDMAQRKTTALNLNQKIYKPFFEFHDFQIVMVVPAGSTHRVEELRDELSMLADIRNWHFVYGDEEAIRGLFASLGTDLSLDEDLGSDYAFIIDKQRNLRGRHPDESDGTKYGYKTTSVAELNNTMEDDVKIILAEYRLALKKNKAERDK